MTAWTIGVDPGLTGAVAILDGDGRLLDVLDMPAADGHVLGTALKDAIVAIRWQHGYTQSPHASWPPIDAAWVEDVHAMPGQGVSSTFKFGRSVGVVAGVLGALDIPIRWVSPAAWKKASGLAKDKGASRRRAQELWPTHASVFQRVKDDGRAEAALIALYGRGRA